VYHAVPVANAIGDSTTMLAGTLVHVYKTDEYELYGPTVPSVVFSAPQLNRAYKEFAKHFGVQAPPMAVVLADTAFVLTQADADAFAKRRIHTFVYVRPHSLRDIEGMPPDLREEEIWPIAGRAAREMLAAFTDSHKHRTPEVEVATHGPDVHLETFPFWFVDAVAALLSDPGAPDRVMEYLRDHLEEAPPVADLLAMRGGGPPPAGDSLLNPRERRQVVGAAGVGLTLMAIEREGPRIVARLADAYLAGGTARDAFRNAAHLPHTDRELDASWRSWVRDESRR
jgi:hypothetical protein